MPLLLAGTRQELAASLAMRIAEYPLWNALFFNSPLVKEQDFSGDVTGEAHLMGDDDHGAPFFGQQANDFKHFANQLRIQR